MVTLDLTRGFGQSIWPLLQAMDAAGLRPAEIALQGDDGRTWTLTRGAYTAHLGWLEAMRNGWDNRPSSDGSGWRWRPASVVAPDVPDGLQAAVDANVDRHEAAAARLWEDSAVRLAAKRAALAAAEAALAIPGPRDPAWAAVFGGGEDAGDEEGVES